MKVVISHPTGNANVRAAAYGLHQAGIMGGFNTSIASFPGGFLDKMGDYAPFAEIRRRRFDSSLRNATKTWPWMELGRLITSRAGFQTFTKHETGLFSVDAVYNNFDKHVAKSLSSFYRQGTNAVYAYEDGAQYSFKKAKQYKVKCFYDLPIGYWRTAKNLLEKESLLRPEWASTLIGCKDSQAKLDRKDDELQMADHIFVASRFTAETLKDFPGALAPVEIIPYGFPPVDRKHTRAVIPGRNPLKLLFVGGLSQRKGIAQLFEAVDVLGRHVELTLVGSKPNEDCPALDAALSKHRWIPTLPHEKVLELMKEQDVLVFPSLFEGFGLVITEAMSQGTPVITTERTAGPDIIKHGESGWLVEAGSAQALQASIENLLQNPKSLVEAGYEAKKKAKERPWEVYGRELAEALRKSIV